MTDVEQQQLIDAAVAVRSRAYAPYSRFLVGAALLTEDGQTFVGVNVENASYGMTICAERSAIFSAVTAGNRKFQAIAIATAGGHAPCGACRQVLAEFSDDLPVFLVDADRPEAVRKLSLKELLPGKFELPE